MTLESLAGILEKHKLWLNGKDSGKHANLSGANLRYANLSGADLRYANLRAEAEREKGCVWCMPEPNEKLEIECARVGRTDWGYCKTAGRVDGDAIYCPMCGKRLEDKP